MSEQEAKPTQAQIEALYKRLDEEAEAGGYHLNPDKHHVKMLLAGILTNEARFGYWACPCRLADGDRQEDLDIICPCDYRDPDLGEYGTCYCALYVSDAIKEGKETAQSIPERRPEEREQRPQFAKPAAAPPDQGGMRLWRCRVCGYLCAREQPPGRCPVCKATKDRFEPLEIMIRLSG